MWLWLLAGLFAIDMVVYGFWSPIRRIWHAFLFFAVILLWFSIHAALTDTRTPEQKAAAIAKTACEMTRDEVEDEMWKAHENDYPRWILDEHRVKC